ncbi:MAG: class I SAM-dependent methyltransferase [Chloroflexota bacterium]
MHSNLDKAGKHYWDNVWEGHTIPPPVDPRSVGLRQHQNHRFHRLFTRVLLGHRGWSKNSLQGRRLLEIGAARSTWLPYFNKEFGLQVTGIDYSEVGCRQAEVILEAAGVEGELICADFFSPPAEMLGAFDVVVSFGVVEHFANTSDALASFASFLKPGGLLITSVPNLTGLLGWIQKRLGRAIYDIHVPLDRDALALAHSRAELQVLSCGYFMSANFSVLNFADWPGGLAQKAAVKFASAVSLLIWALELKGVRIKPNKLTSPYVVCVAAKPDGKAI